MSAFCHYIHWSKRRLPEKCACNHKTILRDVRLFSEGVINSLIILYCLDYRCTEILHCSAYWEEEADFLKSACMNFVLLSVWCSVMRISFMWTGHICSNTIKGVNKQLYGVLHASNIVLSLWNTVIK